MRESHLQMEWGCPYYKLFNTEWIWKLDTSFFWQVIYEDSF